MIPVVVVALLLVPAEVSLGRTLGAPGDTPTSVRLVGWLRDHGGGGLVNIAENWWYSHNMPPPVIDPATVPASVPPTASPGPGGSRPDTLPLGPGDALPNESTWVPSTRRVRGAAPLYTAFFRPLPGAPTVVVGVAWMNQSLVRAQLIAGTLDPRPINATPEPPAIGPGQVPGSSRPTLLATFNSGFKMKDAQGGYVSDGREIEPLRVGAASLTVDTGGHVDVGQWGRDLTMTPNIVSVRQNLDLIVDHGAPVPGLDTNATGAWGSANNQFQFTWRSGLGTDRGGHLIYVAADRVTLHDLALAMTAAGVVRGMELDMHPPLVTFMSYRPGQAASGTGTKLLPAMHSPTTRYLRPSQRDFLAVNVTSP